MRTIRLGSCIAALSSVTLVGLAAAGCSSSMPDGSSASGSATASPSPSMAGVAAKLLTPADLPAGWENDVTPSTAPVSQTDCPLLDAPRWNGPLSDVGEADLSHGLAGPYLVEQVGTGTAAQVTQAWQALTDGIPHCTSYTHTGAQGQSTFTIAKTDMPSYGDSSDAFTLKITITGGVNASGNIVAVRSGNAVVVLYVVGISGVSKATVEGIVSTAAAKART